MKNQKILRLLALSFVVALFSALFITACSDDDDDQPSVNPPTTENKIDVSINFMPKINGQEINYDKRYKLEGDDEIEFASLLFFVSDVYALKASGEKELICEIELIDFDNTTNTYNVSVNGTLPPGDYTGIEFGSGVKESLNNTDPAEFDLDHPLNTTTGMYWTWATNYIFHKFEGRVINTAQDTFTSWFFHTGLDDLYRDNISIDRNFTASGDGVEVAVIFNFDKVLDSEHKLDLWNRGQSHTTDELEIAAEVVDNTAAAFQ